MIAACGGADPVAQAPTHKRFFARHPRTTTHAADAGTVLDGGGEVTPRDVIVMPAVAGPYVLLYPEEQEAVRARVVQRIASLEADILTPWSDEKMRTLSDRVKAGKLRENGPVCALPPTLVDVVDAETNEGANDNLLIATPSLDCDGKEACMIQVNIGALDGEREADLMLSAKVAADGSEGAVDAWLAAADALQEVDELVGSGYGFGSGSAPPFVRAWVRQTLGDFGSTFAMSPPIAALASCHDASTSRRIDISYDALVTVDAAGHATKCAVLEDDPIHEPNAAKREACICQGMQKTKFPAALANANPPKIKANGDDRRALFAITDSPQPRKHAHKGTVDARVNVLEGAGHPEANDVLDIPQLGDCYLDSNPKDDQTFTMKLHLAATGKVDAVEITTVPNQMRACLTRAYLATPFGCDTDGQARELDVGVTLALRSKSPHKAVAPLEDGINLSAGHK